MKRRRQRERDEEDARERADARREALLAELRARQEGEGEPAVPAAAEPSEDEAGGDEPSSERAGDSGDEPPGEPEDAD